MKQVLTIARTYQAEQNITRTSWPCCNGEAVAYAHLILAGWTDRLAGKFAYRVGRRIWTRYGVARGTLCPMCHKGRNCDC